jgi:hypothetical protein
MRYLLMHTPATLLPLVHEPAYAVYIDASLVVADKEVYEDLKLRRKRRKFKLGSEQRIEAPNGEQNAWDKCENTGTKSPTILSRQVKSYRVVAP